MNDGKRLRDLERIAEGLGLKYTKVVNMRKVMRVYFTDGTKERYVTAHRSPSFEIEARLAKKLKEAFAS